MKFKCDKISVDDSELGLTIIFSEKRKNSFDYEDTVNADSNYILIQLSYPEDEYEKYYSFIEFNDVKKSGNIDKYKFHLSKNEFIVKSKDEEVKCLFNISDEKFNEIKEVLERIISGKNKLTIKE